MKKRTKIIGILAALLSTTCSVYASTITDGLDNLSVTWPYYIAVALIVSSFVTFSLIILGTVSKKNKGKKIDSGTKKYLVIIAIVQLLIVGIIPVVVLVNYFTYKPFRNIALVSTVWSDDTNINLLDIKVYGVNRTPKEGISVVVPEEKLEVLKLLSTFEMKAKGIPQLSQRLDLSKWYGQSVEITNIVTGTKVVLEYDNPYCCINNVEYKPKDSMYEKDLSTFIENQITEYNAYIDAQ